MKRIIIYINTLVCCAVSLWSCEDMSLLEEHPKKVDATTFMSNAQEVQSVINSIYSQLRRDPGFGRYLSVLSEGLSDYCYGRGNYATSFSTGLTPGGVNMSKDTWAVLYRAIRFSNEILSQIGDADMTTLQRDHLTGEARFLRAFSYSYLVRYFGAVPFFTEDNMTDFNKPRTAEKTIWEYVYDEAETAAGLLPETVSMAGRPGRHAALMLQTEAALYLERWAEAENAVQKVVESGKFSLVEVATADDFDKLYGHKANASPEEIFYIKYNRDDGETFVWMYLCKPNPVFDTGALGAYTDFVANKFILGWDTRDLRYQYSLYKQTENGTLNGLTSTGMICLKYRDTETNGSVMANDFPVYRYADALLYYAEAICRRAGRPDATAVEMVNRVHRRAYGLPVTQPHASDYVLADYDTADKFMDLVLKERGYETVFEGKRYTDLKRCGKLAEYAVNAGRVNSEDEVRDAAYWWPIPSDEFNYNTALDPAKDQNPGY